MDGVGCKTYERRGVGFEIKSESYYFVIVVWYSIVTIYTTVSNIVE